MSLGTMSGARSGLNRHCWLSLLPARRRPASASPGRSSSLLPPKRQWLTGCKGRSEPVRDSRASCWVKVRIASRSRLSAGILGYVYLGSAQCDVESVNLSLAISVSMICAAPALLGYTWRAVFRGNKERSRERGFSCLACIVQCEDTDQSR
jgi:hypothetical protein